MGLSDRVGATRFALWFGGKVRFGLNREGDVLVVRVPDPFFRDWIERHYKPNLVDAVEAVIGRRLGVSVQIHDENGPAGSLAIDQECDPDGGPGEARQGKASTTGPGKVSRSPIAVSAEERLPSQGLRSTDLDPAARQDRPAGHFDIAVSPASAARRLCHRAGKPGRTRCRGRACQYSGQEF